MNNIRYKDNVELAKHFFTLAKTLSEVEKIIEKYKDAELHAALAKIHKGIEEFSSKMILLTIEVSDDNY